LSFPISGIPPQMLTADNIERDLLKSLPPPGFESNRLFWGRRQVYSSRVVSCLFDGLNTRRTRDDVESDLGLLQGHLQDQEHLVVFG
jgi:hypothetical protein